MQYNNVFFDFLRENIQRLFTKSPKFFRIYQFVLGALVALTGLPKFLEDMGKVFHFMIPESLFYFENTFVAYASSGAFVMSLLTTQSNAVAVDENGHLLKKTNEKALPFTAKMEMKTAIKEGGITPVKTDINQPNQ